MSVRFSSEPSSAADRQVDYTFTYADDEHAPAAAPKGANHQYLQVKQVVLSDTHNIVTFYLQESVAIELGQTSNGMGHACSCAEYEADSPCSHVYWAWDQVIRASTQSPHVVVAMNNSGGEIRAMSRGQQGLINPLQVVSTNARASALRAMIQRRINPEMRFAATVDKEQSRAEQTFMRYSEEAYGDLLRVAGAKIYSAKTAHGELAKTASRLLDAFSTYAGWLALKAAPQVELREAIHSAARLYLFMMRGVVLRVGSAGLRDYAATQFDEDPEGDEAEVFWVYVNRFFLQVGDHIGESDHQDLLLVRRYVGSTMRSRGDGSVVQAFDVWLGN